jgi:hypothetical protein
MPKNILDEDKWEKAKELATEQYDLDEDDGEAYWKLVMGVYKRLKGRYKTESGEVMQHEYLNEELLNEAAGFSKAKRKQIEELVIGVLDRMDKSGYNSKQYKDFFKKMSDAQFTTFMNKFLKDENENFYIEVTPFENGQEPVMEDIKRAADFMKVPLNEYMYMPYANPDGEALRTVETIPVGYLHMKRLQQILSKKNSFSSNIEQRNAKTGQITGDDKNGKVSDTENYALVAIGAEAALKEFLGPRADDAVMKQEMFKDINKDNYTSLKNYTREVGNKQALNTLDVYFTGAGILTDLITPGYAFKRSMEDRNLRDRTHEKYTGK